jgi:hypothetical protein
MTGSFPRTETMAMKFRTALFVALVPLVGCNSWPGGKSTVPPPATGAVVAPNPYYQQPSATPPAFTPPTYGAPGAATAPGFGGAAAPNVNLSANANSNLSWQRPVTKQPTISATAPPASTAGQINPRTTLTSSHSATTGGLQDLTSLPVVPIPGAPQPRPTYPAAYAPATAPLPTPAFTPANYTPASVSGVRDPWRGR